LEFEELICSFNSEEISY